MSTKVDVQLQGAGRRPAPVRFKGDVPREVLDAHAPVPRQIGAHFLQQLSMGHWLAFQRLENPIVAGARLTDLTDEHVMQVACALTVPGDRILPEIADKAAWDARFNRFVGQVPVRDLASTVSAVIEELNAAFATLVPPKDRSADQDADPDAATAGEASEEDPLPTRCAPQREAASDGGSAPTTCCAPSTDSDTPRP